MKNFILQFFIGLTAFLFIQEIGLAQDAFCPNPFAYCNINYVPTPGRPFGMVTSNDGQWLFVGTTEDVCNANQCGAQGGVALYKVVRSNLIFEGVLLITNSAYSSDLKVTHDGKLLVVANSNFTSFIDTNLLISFLSNASSVNPVLGTINDGVTKNGTAAGSIYLNITTDDKFLFVSDENLGQITVINLQKARSNKFNQNSIVGAIPVGQSPVGIIFSADQKYLYTTSEVSLPSWGWPASEQGQGAVIVIDVNIAETNPVDSVVERVPSGINPVRLALSPMGDLLYVTVRGDNSLYVFNTTKLIYDPNRSLISKVPVGISPVGVSLIDNNKYILVANSNRFGTPPQGSLSLLNLSRVNAGYGASSLVETIPAELFPREIASTVNKKTIFVSNYDSDAVEIINSIE